MLIRLPQLPTKKREILAKTRRVCGVAKVVECGEVDLDLRRAVMLLPKETPSKKVRPV